MSVDWLFSEYWGQSAADLVQHLAVILHTADQVLLQGHFTHLLIQIVWDRAAARWAGLFVSSCLRDLLAADAAHLADLLHCPDQVLLHRHIVLPPNVGVKKAESVADVVQQLAVGFHRLGHVLYQNVLHVFYLLCVKGFFIS